MWVKWVQVYFANDKMECKNLFLRNIERNFRIRILEDTFGDDKIIEPWINIDAVKVINPNGYWGVNLKVIRPDQLGGASKQVPFIDEWEKLDQLVAPIHQIDEEKTNAKVELLQDIIGDMVEIDVTRTPSLIQHPGAICEPMCQLRGIESLMLDMYINPKEVHQLAAFLRDATLHIQEQGETAGDWSLTSTHNQQMNYTRDLKNPKANTYGTKRSELWGYGQAQSFTLVSPEMFEEFIFQYQVPILEKFGPLAYGCCEDISKKIKIIKKLPNLRSVSIAPSANVKECAEQLGSNYVSSYRPNPASLICCGFNEDKIHKFLKENLEIFKSNDCQVHFNLNSVETVEGDISRFSKLSKIIRKVIDEVWI